MFAVMNRQLPILLNLTIVTSSKASSGLPTLLR